MDFKEFILKYSTINSKFLTDFYNIIMPRLKPINLVSDYVNSIIKKYIRYYIIFI